MEFNIYDVIAAVIAEYPDRESIVCGDRRCTSGEFLERANRFGNGLLDAGLGLRRERDSLERHESGQAHVALYLRNCPEFMEAMVGSFGARAVSFNVNYRYLADELAYLLNDARAAVVVFHAEFAPTMAAATPALVGQPLLIQVPDGSGVELLPGAWWYEDFLAAALPVTPPVERSPDDLYMIYTGGTTGMPKGVMWRQADAFGPLFGGRRPDGTEWDALDEIVAAAAVGGTRQLPGAPLMHAAGQWPAIRVLVSGNTIVLLPPSSRFDANEFVDVLDAERVSVTNIVGDAFIWPVIDSLLASPRALPHLQRIATGGTTASPRARRALSELLPHVSIYETCGSSETGAQLAHESRGGGSFVAGSFSLLPNACVLAEDRGRRLTTDDNEVGWIASSHRVPIGYLGDAVKTAATFPVIDGLRHSIPGDRVTLRVDGLVDMHGRDSGMINSGGEKVFAEEVERALQGHPGVRDVLVVGRPSQRWGNEVVAVVELIAEADDASLDAHTRSILAPYKVPRAYIRVAEVKRGPAGKADYRWARDLATAAAAPA